MPARHNKTGRSTKSPPFVRIPNRVFDSASYRSLSCVDRAVLAEIIRRYNGSNNGFIGLGVREGAVAVNANKDTVNKSLATLKAVGLIQCGQAGSFNYKVRHSAEWRLTWERCDKTNKQATHAYETAEPKLKRKSQSGKEASTVP